MIITFHKNFLKSYKKLRKGEQIKCDERIALFMHKQFYPLLNNHTLSGKHKGYRSINITGDLRALYEPVSKKTALFIIVDTHSKLYS